MDASITPYVLGLALAGMLAGLWLLGRGLGGYRTATRLGDTSTSTVASMAAGEVRIAGVVEPAEVTLISALQSEPCVYYRAAVRTPDALSIPGVAADDAQVDERAVGFRVRDGSGSVRVFPRGARWDAPRRLDTKDDDGLGGTAIGLRPRQGPAFSAISGDDASAIAALLEVRPAGLDMHPLLRSGGDGKGDRHFTEERIAPGDTVTIVGRALPFGDLVDPAEADVAIGGGLDPDDPEVVGDLAEARAAGLLADDPAEAWGNAAIPGFGIGKPVRAPDLHPDADAPALAATADAARYERTFHIAPTELVLAAGPGTPLLIAHGLPGDATDRHQDRFMIGLLGAVVAIGSAMVLALVIAAGGIGS